MKVYLIILYIYINSTFCQLLNNETLLVFHEMYRGLFTIKFNKTKPQLNENDSHTLTETDFSSIGEIDYSLKANIIVWRHSDHMFYAIPIDKR
jgi:hypothetical protein